MPDSISVTPREDVERCVRGGSGSNVATASYTAGIVYFEGVDDVLRCLESLQNQTRPPSLVIVVDHSGDLGAVAGLRDRYDDVEWIVTENKGYAAGANRVIARSRESCPDAEYILVLNPDVELGRDFCRILIEAVSCRPDVALASGRLLRPGGGIIDSAGIEMDRSRRFRDRGSGEPNDGRYDRVEAVTAVSGAAMMLRCEFLPDLAVDGEVFDEDFFIYHEDTDLAWRARLFGLSCLYVPGAVATHVRRWRRAGRARIADHVRRHSFKNRYLEMVKNERAGELLRDAPFVVGAEVARLFFAMMVDRTLLQGYWDAFKHFRRAWARRKIIHRRVGMRPRRDLGRSDHDGTGRIGKNRRMD